jgi:hypothetical protein
MPVLLYCRPLIAFGLLILAGMSASAQTTVPGCTPRQVDKPPRTVFDCTGGLIIEAEAAARLNAGAAQSATAPDAIELQGGAALIELKPGGDRPFQIRTPHAIASVRGTLYAVDVTANKTAVFVARGSVRVTRLDGRAGVTLKAGKGTEVRPGKRFTAHKWSTARVSELMARFGR